MAEEAARLGSGAAPGGDGAAAESALAALPLLPPLLGAPALRGDVICAPLLASAGALLAAAAAAADAVPEDAMVRPLRV
jgi:energy-converting hydrogenase Eha subunit B